MTVFALLHGGMHHGWCWDLVTPLLVERGHRVLAPDLPVDDDAAGAREWAAIALDALRTGGCADEDVVVVGHSISGLCVPVLAAASPIRRMVFVGALVPDPGRSFADHLAENPDAFVFPASAENGTGPFGLTFEAIRDGFYHDCSEALARKAFDTLRGQAFTVFTERCPIDRWPAVPSTYLLMRDDRAVGREWAYRSAHRIGADVVELDGGHSPFFAQPTALADVLHALADGR